MKLRANKRKVKSMEIMKNNKKLNRQKKMNTKKTWLKTNQKRPKEQSLLAIINKKRGFQLKELNQINQMIMNKITKTSQIM